MTSTTLLIDVLRSLRRPLRPLAFFLPGARGKLLQQLAKGEAALEQTQDATSALTAVAAVTERASEEVAANRESMERVARIQENRAVQDQITQQKLGEHLQALRQVAEGNLRLSEREDAVKQREAFSREIGGRLQVQIEATTKRQDETHALLKEANSLFAAVQALLEESNQRRREADEEHAKRTRAADEEDARRQRQAAEQAKALEERTTRLEAFKAQLIAREQSIRQAEARLTAVEQQRAAVEEEIKALRKQRDVEAARTSEMLRERERTLVKREEDVIAASLLMTERERALQEREDLLDVRDADQKKLVATLADLQTSVTEKEKQIATLQESFRGLDRHSQELQKLLAGLSARL